MTFAGGVIWISWIFYIFGRAVWGRRISMLSSWFQINWIKIVDEEQRSHGLRKRSKASVKEQEERTVKKSAHKKKQWKEKSERRFDMDPPSLRCLLCDAFIFFWEGGDQRFFVLLFFPFSLFLLFFLWEGGDQRCFSFTPQSVKLFFVFPSFFFFLEGENQMWFSFMPKALIFLHPDFLILHGIFSTARKMLT